MKINFLKEVSEVLALVLFTTTLNLPGEKPLTFGK